MSENEFDRTAQGWLQDGPTRMSDRALQAALDEVHVTRQRRLWWQPRRFLAMNTPMRRAGATGLLPSSRRWASPSRFGPVAGLGPYPARPRPQARRPRRAC